MLASVDWKRECAAVIPCYNEAATISQVVAETRLHLPLVLVVDDGSTDGTAGLAQREGAQLIRHDTNRGKGAALGTGFDSLRQQQIPWVLTLDGDGQHAPADIPAILDQAQASDADLVIGNRMHNAGSMPWIRRLANRWMTRGMSRKLGIPIADSQCGFRLFKLEALASTPLRSQHFEIESEVLAVFAQARKRIEFTPIRVIYKSQSSKIHLWHDTLRWIRWWWKV